MKYQLETIPVWEAYEAETECPLCFLQQKLEKYSVSFFLGSSVMEPSIRKRVNESGFCPHHFHMLFHAGNKLGLALMTHTYVRSMIKGLEKSKKKVIQKGVSDYVYSLKKKTHECVLCDKLEKTLKRYTFTIVYLWKKEEEFRKTFLKSQGFCFSHFSDCIIMADETLGAGKRDSFLNDIYQLQMKNVKRLEEELHWFTQKFDYKNKDKSWKNSKDSLSRTLQKVSGKIIE